MVDIAPAIRLFFGRSVDVAGLLSLNPPLIFAIEPAALSRVWKRQSSLVFDDRPMNVSASGYHFCHSCRPVFRFALHFIFALMILGGYGLIHGEASMPLGVVLIFAGVYWFTLRPFERRWVVRHRFNKRPDRRHGPGVAVLRRQRFSPEWAWSQRI